MSKLSEMKEKLADASLSSIERHELEMMAGFLEKDIQVVEDTFQRIHETCGPAARVIMWMLYVEEKSFEETAGEMGFSVGGLRNKVNEWNSLIFKSDDSI